MESSFDLQIHTPASSLAASHTRHSEVGQSAAAWCGALLDASTPETAPTHGLGPSGDNVSFS